jgi:hypothetical protein
MRILYPRTVTVCLRLAERVGEWKSLIRLQVAKSDEPRFFACLALLCVVVHPTLNGPAASNSRHPPSVLSRPHAETGRYSQTRLCGGVSALQSRSNDPSDRVH